MAEDTEERLEAAEHIKVPIALVMKLAECLQWVDLDEYGNGLSADQIRQAETVIKRFVRANALPQYGQWRSMESAPRDASVILLLARRFDARTEIPVFGQCHGDGAWFDITWTGNTPMRLIPIAWMPRPSFVSYRETYHAERAIEIATAAAEPEEILAAKGREG